MKSIVKVFTTPFRSSKNKKSTKQQSHSDDKKQNEKQRDDLQNNINLDKIVSKDQIKSSFFYSQVQKMVDQLGGMFQFKEKMTQEQKRELIYELSSIAMNDKRVSNCVMDQDVLSDEDDVSGEKQTDQGKYDSPKNAQNLKQRQSQAVTRSSQDNSPKSQSSPEKQLKDLFEQFQHQQKQQKSQLKNTEQKQSLSTFNEIRSQMGKFWSKNSSKVLKLMKSKKGEKLSEQTKTKTQSQKTIAEEGLKSKKEKRKSSFMGNIFPSWHGKKQDKALNMSTPEGKVESIGATDLKQSPTNEKNKNQVFVPPEITHLGFTGDERNN